MPTQGDRDGREVASDPMDDVALPQHHRSGAHRVRRHPLLVAVLTLAAVAAASAALLWVLLSFDVLGVGDDLLEAGGVTPGPSAGASAAAVATGGASAPVSGPAPSEPAPGAGVDRSAPLAVLNATTTSGLATEAAGVLEQAGWTVAEVGNYGGDDGPSAVLWPEDDPAADELAAAATVVAADLGVGGPAPSPDVDVLTVVVGQDFRP